MSDGVEYFGAGARDTEAESGRLVADSRRGPMKRGGAEHMLLYQFRHGEEITAYEASRRACGDFHGKRREARRLVMRGFLEEVGTAPNPAPAGRPSVIVYKITAAGLADLRRVVGL